MLRRGGRILPSSQRKPLAGDLHTRRFKGGDTWVKVLEFQQSNCAPGQHELYDPRVKDCVSEKPAMVLSGVVREEDAWVVQEWEIEVALPLRETPVGSGWIKPRRRYESLG